MADRGHDRGEGGGDGAHQRLVGEGQEVFERAATARDHDDVDLGHGVELQECGAHGPRGLGALHRDRAHLELDGRPPATGVLDDVVLGRAGSAADQADSTRQERQAPLAAVVEEPLLGKQPPAGLEKRKELAEPHGADLDGLEPHLTASLPPLDAGVHDHARALGERGSDGVDDAAGRSDLQRDLRRGVAQHQEAEALAGADGDLGHLPLDPHAAEAADPVADAA